MKVDIYTLRSKLNTFCVHFNVKNVMPIIGILSSDQNSVDPGSWMF